MEELLNIYKINEWYDHELKEITYKYNEIRDRYKEISSKYEDILNVLTKNRKKMEEFIDSWRVLNRENQRRLEELYEQQNELKRTSENLRHYYWELGETVRELKSMSTWFIYGKQCRYEWAELREREYIANETERYFEDGSRSASYVSNELCRSRDLTEAMMDMANKN